MAATEATKAAQVQAAKIAHAVALLEAYRNKEAVLWDHLPEAFAVVFGRPLNKDDAHDAL